jgi:Tfp pilus assembly protein PilF
VVALWPKDVRALYTLGVCSFEAGDQVTSVDALCRALERDPRHHNAHTQLALVHLDAARDEAARGKLYETLKLKPDYGPAHYALGRSLVDEDPARARHHLRESLLTSPPMLRAHLDLGRLHQRSGRLQEAKAEYKLFSRHHPEKRRAWIDARIREIDAALLERR